jgi:Zn-dependent protease with chaperone function
LRVPWQPARRVPIRPSTTTLTYGISGQQYWLAPGAVDNNENAIVSGVGLWNATSTPVSYSRTYTQSASRMDFYYNATGGYCATTYYYVNTTTVNPNNQNWWWGKVYTTQHLKEPSNCGNADHRKAVLAHEQGHVMGLDHAVSSSRLMYTWIGGTNVNAPQPDDVDGINYLY